MKPAAWSSERAASFLDDDTVQAYRHRAPYPEEIYTILSDLITDSPRVVLDVGCGTGVVARNLVRFVDRVDALDPSQAMITAGRKMPGGDEKRIQWIKGTAEDAALNPPYCQIVAAMSIHWLDWAKVMPRFQRMLTPRGFLVIVYNSFGSVPWEEELRALRHATRGFEYPRPLEAVDELVKEGLFNNVGQLETQPCFFTQPIAEYIEQFHSRSDMARVKIGAKAAQDFDERLQEILQQHNQESIINIEIRGQVVWGKPLN